MKIRIFTTTIFALACLMLFAECFFSPNPDKEFCRLLLSEYAARQGMEDVVMSQAKKSRISHYSNNFAAYRYVAKKIKLKDLNYPKSDDLTNCENKEIVNFELLKARLQRNKFYSPEDIKIANELKNPYRASAFAELLRIAISQGNKGSIHYWKELILKNVGNPPPISYYNALSESIKIMSPNVSLKEFLLFYSLLPPSEQNHFLIYGAYFNNPKLAKEVNQKDIFLKDGKFKQFQVLFINAKIFQMYKNDRKNIEKKLIYIARNFQTTWAIKRLDYYRYPIFAYLAKLSGEEKLFQEYKRLSTIPEQLHDMRGGYVGYIRYAVHSFARLGEWQESLRLISTLSNPNQRFKVLKETSRVILESKEAIEAFEQILD